MGIVATTLIIIVALLHSGFLYLEMFAWTSRAPRVFRGFDRKFFVMSKGLAANQGLYNGFLAAGLLWSLLISDPVWQGNVAVFFLGCMIIAGIFGAVTVSKRIVVIQSGPAILALAGYFLGV
jgi:putative membrane protein